MKKRKLLLLGIACVLLSCGNGSQGSTSNSKTDSSLTESTLSVKAIKKAYYQYDAIDYDDFSVKEEASKSEIKDFTISLDGKTLENKKTRIYSFGDVTLTFHRDGFIDATLKISVKKSSNLDERLVIDKEPSKTEYQKGEKFVSDGLEVSYQISYTKQNRERVSAKEPYSDYQIKIDGINASDYTFSSEGYTIKYAVVSSLNELENSLVATFPLYQSAKEKKDNQKLEDAEQKYVWSEIDSKMKVKFANPNASLEKAYYSPDEINLDYNLNAFSDRDASNFKQTPSLGEVPLLVVPIVLNGYEEQATDENHQKLERGFFGKAAESSTPSSLASYYYYSSYKQLKFVGEVTPYFNPSKEGYQGYSNPRSFNINTPESLAKDALNWLKEKQKVNLDDYDSDNDGYIDGIWLIYMEDPNNSLTINVNQPFWPFTSCSTLAPGTKESPTLNTFAWAGTTHLWGNYADPSYVATQGIDPHVLEHETGHMLGLSDYYSYSPTTTNESYYSPLGRLDIMDMGFGDHNPYSKMLLGWTKPYLVLDDCEIEIPSSQKENSFFLLPYDNKTYKKDEFGRIILNPFDEYLILDYYTYENFYKDNYNQYGTVYSYPSEAGGRLYHIDSRLLHYYDESDSFSLPSDPDIVLNSSEYFYRCITNTQAGERAETKYKVSSIKDYFDEIRLISSDKDLIDGNNRFDASALFKKDDSFKLSDYASQFHYDGKFDNQKNFSLEFTILSL